MNKAYSRINFQNAPSTATPLNATNLNKIDKAINDLDDRIIELSGYQEEAQEAAEQASSSASAAAKAAETATADAEARVNEIIAGMEVYTKEESDKKFASVIKQVATGSPILIKDSSDAGVIDFKGKGRSTQKQYSGKNFLKCSLTTAITQNGITFTPVYDGKNLLYINVNGTATNNAYTTIASNVTIPSGTYILNGCPSGGGESTYRMYTNSLNYFDYGNGATFTLNAEYTFANLVIYVFKGQALNNLKFYPMIRLADTDSTYEPYVSGTASPNPDYPQTIKSVGDGGWFDGELLQGVYYIGDGLLKPETKYVCNKNPIPCKANDEIKIKYDDTSVNELFILYYDENMKFLSHTKATSASIDSVAPTKARYFNFDVGVSTGITPQNAKPITVTINGKYALIVKSRGKNLLNINQNDKRNEFSYTEFTNESIKATANVTTRGTFICSSSAYLEKGKTYTFSHESINGMMQVYIYYDKLWGNFVSSLDILSIPNYTHNADSGIYIIGYYGAITSGKEYSVVKPMLRPAEIEDDTYEPYKESVTYIPLNEPLRSNLDGTVTDEVSLTGVTRRFKEVVFDGSDDEGWENGQQADNVYRYNMRVADIKLQRMGAICTHFTPNPAYVFTSITEVSFATHPTSPELAFFTETTTIDEWKTWLQANPITVQYELAEPVVEEIEPVDIVTYDNVTYLTASDNAEMEVTYATDTKSYIDSKFAELHAALVNML